MVHGWIDGYPVLASVADGWMQGIVMALVMGACVAGGVLWLAKRRWEPAVQHLTSLVEREVHQADHAAQALRVGLHAQAQRAQRQASSVHGAIAGVRALHNITEELDQCADDLKHLAQLIAAESAARRAAPGLADHVGTSAKHLALTAEQARQTYRRLHASVNQLVAEASSMQANEQEAEQHARDLTGAVERLRQGVRARPHRADAAAAPRPRLDAPPPRRYRPDALPDDPPPYADSPRRPTARRDPPARPPDWYDDAEAPASDRRLRPPESDRAGRERLLDRAARERAIPALRSPSRQRRAEDDAPDRRPTRRRDDPDARYATRPPDRYPDDESGWLDHDDRRYGR